MAVQPMDATMSRGRQQFRLQPISHAGPQPYPTQRNYDPSAFAYDYRYPQQQVAYPYNQQYGGAMGGYGGGMYAPRQEPPPPPPQPQQYISENEGYVINGVWYPYQQPLSIPETSQRSQRVNRRGYPTYPSDLRHGGIPDGYGAVVYGSNRGPPDPYQQPDVPILERVRNQLEYYFSAKNLSNDSYMRGLMRQDGYIPLSLMMEFPRMKVHKISPALAVRAANESPHLKVMGIDYPLQEGRPRDYFLRTKHSWWKYVPNPDVVPDEEKIEDDASELVVAETAAPPQRAKQSLWPGNTAAEDTKTARRHDPSVIPTPHNRMGNGVPPDEDTKR